MAPLHVDGYPALETSPDLWADGRRAMARMASILLHLLVLGLLFIHWPEPKHEAEPPEIPVEIVMAPPPKLKVEPTPQPTPQPLQGESGGDPNLPVGQLSEAPIPHPAKKPSAKAQEVPNPTQSERAAQAPAQHPAQTDEAPKTPATPPAPAPLPQATAVTPWPPPVPKPAPPTTLSSSALTKAPAPVPKPAAPVDKTPPQIASLPPDRTPAMSQPESRLRGFGGGDPYLNAMRDDIVSNIIYPKAANGSAGMARYVLTVSRQGFLLDLHLLQSSGSTALDRAGLDAIQNTAPFRPLPPRIPGNSIQIEALLNIAPWMR